MEEAKKSGESREYSVVVKELQEIVKELEGGSLSLEKSLEKFDRGMKVVKEAEKLLAKAEARIEELLVGDGSVRPLDLEPKGKRELTAGVDLHAWMDARRERLEQLLAAALALRTPPAPLGEALEYALLGGGKRLRPLLVFAFAEASGLAESSPATDDAAVAMEFIHAYSLVHDDLPAFDDAATRRGKPSCHLAYGEATAVLVGDGLLTDAFAMLSRGAPAEAAFRLRLVHELAQAAGSAGMVGGQQLDMTPGRPATLEALAHLHALKTGALLRAACRMGALSAQVSEERLAQATHYGEAIGLAFQIADDILDETAHPEALGKPTKADASAGKVTYPSLVGLAEARRLAHEQVRRAQAAAAAFGDARGLLAAIANYAVERTT